MVKLDVDEVVDAIGVPFDRWAHNCHGISLAIVKSGLVGEARVARGGASGVRSQHSWVVLGWDCFTPKAKLLDPTLWAYREDVSGIWVGSYTDGMHEPHGTTGSIWQFGRPPSPVEDPIELRGFDGLSETAREFLGLCGPLDQRGWHFLVECPTGGWPAKEITEAILDDPALGWLVPIDREGMLTDRNPNGLYF